MKCKSYQEYLSTYREFTEAIGGAERELKEAEGAYLRAEADPEASAGLKETLHEAVMQCAAQAETAEHNLAALKEDNKEFEQDRKIDRDIAAVIGLAAPDGVQGVTLPSGEDVRVAAEEVVRHGELFVQEVKEGVIQTAVDIKNQAAEFAAHAQEFGREKLEDAKEALVDAGQKVSNSVTGAIDGVSSGFSDAMGKGMENLGSAYSVDPAETLVSPPPPPPPPEPEKGTELGHGWSPSP